MNLTLSEAGWFLPYEAVKHLTSLPRLLEHAKRAHYTNATVRKDGRETIYEADWIKHLRWVPPSPAPGLQDTARNLMLYADECELILRDTHPGKAASLAQRIAAVQTALAFAEAHSTSGVMASDGSQQHG